MKIVVHKNEKNLASIIVTLAFFSPQIVLAKKTIGDAGQALESVTSPTGLPKTEVATYVGNVAQWLFGIVGLIFLALTVYAGMQWFLARGEDEKITKAKQTLITAIIGLILAVSAYAIANFVSVAVLGS